MKGLVLAALACLLGCSRGGIERVEWLTMGTVAAVQARGTAIAGLPISCAQAKDVCQTVNGLFNAHSAASELSRLQTLPETEILKVCTPCARPCYAAAFALRKATGGAFNPSWRGPNTLDLGAIAKGFAADLIAERLTGRGDLLVDLGGNLKAVGGDWKTGVRDPASGGIAARVVLRAREALATSATYYRGQHIRNGRTGEIVTNSVASVTVLHPSSAMRADGLSTALFVLGPDAGRAFLDAHDPETAALWILADGRRVRRDPRKRFGR